MRAFYFWLQLQQPFLNLQSDFNGFQSFYCFHLINGGIFALVFFCHLQFLNQLSIIAIWKQ